MCRELRSIERLSDAVDAFDAACRRLCDSDVSCALRTAYNGVLAEGVKPDETKLIEKLK